MKNSDTPMLDCGCQCHAEFNTGASLPSHIRGRVYQWTSTMMTTTLSFHDFHSRQSEHSSHWSELSLCDVNLVGVACNERARASASEE
jgi:hypothetical protein